MTLTADATPFTPSTLSRRAEEALQRLGDHPSLLFEGRWQSSFELAARARRAAQVTRLVI